VSQSTHKVGFKAGQQLIAHADESFCGQHIDIRAWSTDDLADFVQGVLEASVESLAELRPECVREITEAEARAQLREMRLRRMS